MYRGAPAVACGTVFEDDEEGDGLSGRSRTSDATIEQARTSIIAARTPSRLRSCAFGLWQLAALLLPSLAVALASIPAAVLLFRHPHTNAAAATTASAASMDATTLVASPAATHAGSWFGAGLSLGAWRFVLLPLPLAACFLLLLVLVSVALKWILIGRFKVPQLDGSGRGASASSPSKSRGDRFGLARGQLWMHSFAYARKWTADLLLDSVASTLHNVFASLFAAPYFRLLGARVGVGAEISTLPNVTPDLIRLGAHSFVADSVTLGAARMHLHAAQFGAVRVDDRSFVGNSALLPLRSRVRERCLIGVMSTLPRSKAGGDDDEDAHGFSDDDEGDFSRNGGAHSRDNVLIAISDRAVDASGAASSVPTLAGSQRVIVDSGTDWLGSPPFRLPRRATHTATTATELLSFDHRSPVAASAASAPLGSALSLEESTFSPPRSLVLQRAAIELVRIVLPTALSLLALMLLLEAASEHSLFGFTFGVRAHEPSTLWTWLALLPLLQTSFAITTCALVCASKWALCGRFGGGSAPLWSHFVWRAELVTGLCEALANPLLIHCLRGTPFLPLWLRCMGASVGRRVFIDSCEITEFDLVHIGDEAAVGADAVLQTHLFEDRVMKMAGVRVGRRASVGASAVVLYDTEVEEGARLGVQSLLMKGERLPACTAWMGIPAQAVAGGGDCL